MAIVIYVLNELARPSSSKSPRLRAKQLFEARTRTAAELLLVAKNLEEVW